MSDYPLYPVGGTGPTGEYMASDAARAESDDDLDDTLPMVPPIPPELCGVGGCAYLPHPLGTQHSWAPPYTQRPGETIRDAERRTLASPEVVVTITSQPMPSNAELVRGYLAGHAHRWAYLTRGGQECVVCGARR